MSLMFNPNQTVQTFSPFLHWYEIKNMSNHKQISESIGQAVGCVALHYLGLNVFVKWLHFLSLSPEELQ